MKKIMLLQIAIFLSCLLHAQCMEDFMKMMNKNPHLIQPVGADPSLIYAWDLIKSRPQMCTDLDVLNATNRLLKNNAGWASENEDLFNRILKNLGSVGARCRTCTSQGFNLGIPFIDVTIDDVSSIIKRSNGRQEVQRLLSEMGQQVLDGKKADGGAFILNVLRHKPDEFISSIHKFEFKYLDDANFEADIALVSGRNIEYKSYSVGSWEAFGSADNIAQVKAYFSSENPFEYVANAAKLNTVVGNPTDFVKKQFQRVMKKEGVIEALYDANQNLFKNITYQGKPISNIDKIKLRQYIELSDFYTSSLFDTIKVE